MTMLPLIAVLCLQDAKTPVPAKDAAPTPPAAPASAARAGKVDFPHPLISEVLYSVPGGKSGDANKDGVRSATGDEFIELVNPHDKPIELEGYRLTDGQPTGSGAHGTKDAGGGGDKDAKPKDGQKDAAKDSAKPEANDSADDHEYHPLAFTFPKLTLQPGEVVVVFNGFESTIPGPVGDSSKAAEKNDQFANAYVFTMKATSSYQALSNQNDMVVLSAPKGEAIECVRWDFRSQQSQRGKSRDANRKGGGPDKEPQRPRDKHAEAPAQLVEELPNARNSVQRESQFGAFRDHTDLDSALFSPGVFGAKKAVATPTPATDQPAKPGKGSEGK